MAKIFLNNSIQKLIEKKSYINSSELTTIRCIAFLNRQYLCNLIISYQRIEDVSLPTNTIAEGVGDAVMTLNHIEVQGRKCRSHKVWCNKAE